MIAHPWRSAWSGGLLAASFLYPTFSDALNVTIAAFFPNLLRGGPTGDFAGSTMLGLQYPHTLFHAIGGAIVTLVVLIGLAVGVVRGPYRRGERWAWRILVFGGLVSLVVKLAASFAIFMHPVWYGLEQDVQIPVTLLALGLLLSRREETLK